MLKFRLIRESEDNLMGPADPMPHILTAGGNQGTYTRYSESILITDSRVATGAIVLPPGYSDPVYNVDWLCSHLACVLEGPEEWLFDPVALQDFFEVAIYSETSGALIRKFTRPAAFGPETFAINRFLQLLNNSRETAFQCNDLGWDGERTATHLCRIIYRVNPKYGDCDPIAVTLEFRGHNLKILPQPVSTAVVWIPIAEGDMAPPSQWNQPK